MTKTPLRALADDFLDFRQIHDFESALWSGELAHVESWPDVTEHGLQAQLDGLERFAGRAAALTAQTDAERLLAETIAFTTQSRATQIRWNPELRWLSPAIGLVSLVFTFLPQQPLVDGDHGERYLSKIHGFPAFVGAWTALLEQAAATGIVPSRHQVEALLAGFDRWLAAPLSAGPIGTQPAPRSFDERHAALWRSAMHAALDEVMAPALTELRRVVEATTLPMVRSDDQPGLIHLEGGAEHYERLVWAHTSLDVSAARVHEIGLEQVARLEDEYRSIAGPEFGTTDPGEIYQRLRDDPALHYQDATALVSDATRILARAADSLDGWFGITPQAPCTANAIEQGPLAFYSRPSRDGSQPGRFFFNTADPSMWGTFQLEAVTYHEGIPGHHLQLAIAQENTDLHWLLSDYYVAAYNEGWGLYSERLADEMGLYSTPLDRVGMLSADSMRACRLVVDTGIHALGWTRGQAIEFMVTNSPMTLTQVEGEIDRYIGDPGQALGYMMGRIEIDAIRANAESVLGDRFEIAAFHDTVLSTGSVPLASVRRVVDEWIRGRSV